jgi:hypothetical protein
MSDEVKSPAEQWKAEEVKRQLKEARKAGKAVHKEAIVELAPELREEWNELLDRFRVMFPSNLSGKFVLEASHKTLAVAKLLGWTYEKIVLASGFSQGHVTKILARPEVKEFMQAFEWHQGSRPAKELVAKEAYQSLEVLRTIRDDPSLNPGTRADIAKWFYEQQYGKPKEFREIQGTSIRDLTRQLQEMQAKKLADPADALVRHAEESKGGHA